MCSVKVCSNLIYGLNLIYGIIITNRENILKLRDIVFWCAWHVYSMVVLKT